MIEVLIPNRKHILFHIGNYSFDSKGCILLGNTANKNQDFVAESTKAYQSFYKLVYPVIEAGHNIELEIE